ncbi:MAG TPA: antibiotic biosynthesis monooxygenase [Bryobacteraceae bacterium]|nr:antibiotic biosynthesis monooxygenase [Bryobacteraceae bacterium]
MTPHLTPNFRKPSVSWILTAALALLFAVSLAIFPGHAFAQGGRVHVVTLVDATPDNAEVTAKALLAFAADARKEPGAVRIDVLRESGRHNHFTLEELWESRAAFDAHVTRASTKAFRERLHPWLGSPYDERLNEEVK